jgi:Tol biopolymer transport system component
MGFSMKNCPRIAIILTVASFCFLLPARPALAQELNAEAKSKEAVEARAKRNAQIFQNNASILTFLDRYGKHTGQIGERALYDATILSPDGKRIAAIKDDLENESADLWVFDVASGAVTRFTTSVRTEFVETPVWSPDSSRLAYVAMRKGQEGVYLRASNGKGAEELLYKNPGAFLGLSDWSSDGRFLTFAISDLKGGSLYIFPLDGGPDRKPVEIFHSELRISDPHFSPDGRYLSYVVIDKTEKQELFVRPSDPKVNAGPWQISNGSLSPGFWVRGGKQLCYVARDQSVMAAEVSTSPSFSFTKPTVLFRQKLAVPDTLMHVSSDGDRFLVLPPARGQELQQITIFDQGGKVVKKVGEPALYSVGAFSPEGNRLLVMKKDLDTGQEDLWVLNIDSAKATRITNDVRFKTTPLWSPDGKYILYSALLDGDWPIYRIAADGTGKEEVLFRHTPGAFVGLSDVSPDGNFFICDSGGVIMLVPLAVSDPAARKPIEYLRDEFNEGTGRISPDGRLIAYRSDEAKPERFEIYVRSFDAAKAAADDKKWRVSKDGVFGDNIFFGFPTMLHWRADGKEILFRALELDSNDLVMMAAEVETTPALRVGTPKMLFRLPGPVSSSLGGVSRDGQRFVLPINVPAPADKAAQPSGSK